MTAIIEYYQGDINLLRILFQILIIDITGVYVEIPDLLLL